MKDMTEYGVPEQSRKEQPVIAI